MHLGFSSLIFPWILFCMIWLNEVARLTGGRLDGKEKMTLQGFLDFYYYYYFFLIFLLFILGGKKETLLYWFFFLLHVGIKITRESALWNFWALFWKAGTQLYIGTFPLLFWFLVSFFSFHKSFSKDKQILFCKYKSKLSKILLNKLFFVNASPFNKIKQNSL